MRFLVDVCMIWKSLLTGWAAAVSLYDVHDLDDEEPAGGRDEW